MARYIDADKLLELLREYKQKNIEWGVPYTMNAGINQAIMAINKLITDKEDQK